MTQSPFQSHSAASRSAPPTQRWHNWAGNVSCAPRRFLYPRSEQEVRQAVLDAARDGLRVRVVGAGHSFTAAAACDDVLLSLDRLSGLQHFDPQTGNVTVRAGTRLYDLNHILAGLGRAQENMGDINRQSLAGAVCTGTHGTGLSLGSVGTQIVGLRLIDGQGQVRTITADEPDKLSAARLSLGALGVITSVTLRTVPAYRLKMDIRPGHFDEVLHLGQEYARANRHFEFYWVPYTNAVQLKHTNPTDEPAQPDGPLQVFNDVVLENAALQLLSEVNKAWPAATRGVCQIIGAAITPNTRVQPSHEVFGSIRNLKFSEMEYAVPLEALPQTLRDLRSLMERRSFPISLPIEVRYVQGDDVMLSSAYGRDSGYVAIHAYRGVNADDYFREAEAVFRSFDGRPHWGKCHTLGADDFQRSHPRFADFLAVREGFDPARRLTNPYLNRVLGE